MSVVVLAGLSVGAAEAAGGGPKATGGAHSGVSDLSFNAQGTPQASKGRVNYRGVDISFKGEVTCYLQDGNEATFTGVIRKSEGTTDTTFSVEVVDGGEGAGAMDTFAVDTFASGQEPDACEGNDETDQLVINGNIQVHETE